MDLYSNLPAAADGQKLMPPPPPVLGRGRGAARGAPPAAGRGASPAAPPKTDDWNTRAALQAPPRKMAPPPVPRSVIAALKAKEPATAVPAGRGRALSGFLSSTLGSASASPLHSGSDRQDMEDEDEEDDEPMASTERSERERKPAPAQPAAADVLNLKGEDDVVREEYNPARPNDYEEFVNERAERRKQEKAAEKARKLKEEIEKLEAVRRQNEPAPGPPGGLALNVSGDEAFRRRQAMSRVTTTPAQNMMSNMGFQQGQGLGKQNQGITQPIEPLGAPPPRADIPKKRKMERNTSKTPTKVIMLRNMVGAGEADPDLEEETANECAEKYGRVGKCTVFEVHGAPDDEAVRIFVQFFEHTAAIKAYSDLNGRFFGGRAVRADYFLEDAYIRKDYAP